MHLLPAPRMLSARIPFAGFYGSIWDDAEDREHESLIEYWQEGYDGRERRDRDLPGFVGLTNDDIDAGLADHNTSLSEMLSDVSDYSEMHRQIAQDYADAFAAWLADSLEIQPLVKQHRSSEVSPGFSWKIYEPGMLFEFEEMTSPKFYNFETDRLFGKFSETVLTTLYQRLHAEPYALGDVLTPLARTFQNLFTSRDGFASFYGNEVPEKPLAEWDHNELYALLVAWTEQQLDGRDINMELYEDIYEDVYAAFSNAVDWDALARKSEELADDIKAEMDPDYVRQLPPPRCRRTIEMPL